MLSNSLEKKTIKQDSWLWRKIVLPLLLVLLTLGFVGMNTEQVGASAPLHFARPATVSTQMADATPALIAWNATLYVSWTGRNATHNLNIMTYNQATKTFSPATVFMDTTLVGVGPSLAIFNGNLAVAWLGTDHHLNVAFYKPGDPTHLANKVTLGETSYNAPSIAVYNGRLYLSWRGTDGRLNIISSANASAFNTKVTYNITVRTNPTLQESDGILFMAWEDTSAALHLVFAQYNPANPPALSGMVTTTTSTMLPVGLFSAGVAAPDLRVVWTDNHARINWGIYVRSPNLVNTGVTTQTSPYGPALYMPFLGWTGTDAARSVNVMQVSY